MRKNSCDLRAIKIRIKITNSPKVDHILMIVIVQPKNDVVVNDHDRAIN